MTEVTIQGEKFFLNGKPTYKGRTFRGYNIEGLLLNSRMVQATFDDANPKTRSHWAYPDTGAWDAERNVREFLEALPVYREHGLLAVTVNFQGGCPKQYDTANQPWINTALAAHGKLKPDYLDRMRRVLDRLDELGMVAILGVFYFGQDERLADETAVIRALDNAVNWVLDRGYRNVLIEVNNECDVKYEHEILQPHRVSELIERVKGTTRDGRRLLVGASFGGGTIPAENVVQTSDFLLMHGNGVSDPHRIAEMVDQARAVPGYRPMPILFNEDDHFDFDKPFNNFIAALSRYASWGYFDPGENNYHNGFQSPPVQWMPNTERKRAFLRLIKEITGS